MRDASVAGMENLKYIISLLWKSTAGDDSVTCTGAEALVLEQQRAGLYSAKRSLSPAEYLGLINPIGNHMLLQACRACKQWNEGGCPEYRVHVNLSVIQLLQPDIVDTIQKAIQETRSGRIIWCWR